MRSIRVIVRAALIAAFTAVAVPALAASRPPAYETAIDGSAFAAVRFDGLSVGRSTMTFTPDLAFNSDGSLGATDALGDAAPAGPSSVPDPRPSADQPDAKPIVVVLNPWRYDRSASFYGPGFYGKRTACGLAYTTTILGVAHRTLPCGTLVTFRNPSNGAVITVPVIDRGPYVAGRIWDLSGAACLALGHCYTGPIYWKFS
ncbi:MAG TPA: septal ring lytic transglycosylase RlpA family protein [Candidatus Limnocylindrales bacterium]|nr:septal ring lytic transglycosylase RlpA family protein [Candidatus Limnocylindrales bacterium]